MQLRCCEERLLQFAGARWRRGKLSPTSSAVSICSRQSSACTTFKGTACCQGTSSRPSARRVKRRLQRASASRRALCLCDTDGLFPRFTMQKISANAKTSLADCLAATVPLSTLRQLARSGEATWKRETRSESQHCPFNNRGLFSCSGGWHGCACRCCCTRFMGCLTRARRDNLSKYTTAPA
jgi:hypothetical protein